MPATCKRFYSEYLKDGEGKRRERKGRRGEAKGGKGKRRGGERTEKRGGEGKLGKVKEEHFLNLNKMRTKCGLY